MQPLETVPGVVDEVVSADVPKAVAEIQEHFQAYESAREYDDINLWEFNQISREGRTVRQADIEYDPNFCFGGTTKVITSDGVRRLIDMCDESVELWTAEGWRKGEVKSFGVQQLNKVVFAPAWHRPGIVDSLGRKRPGTWVKSNTGHKNVVRVTANHLWELVDGTETQTLKVGDNVKGQVVSGPINTAQYDSGWLHGMMFADGRQCNTNRTPDSKSYEIRLCGNKKNYLWKFEESPLLVSVNYPASANGEPVIYLNSRKHLKDLPEGNEGADYIRGFVAGWLAGDGDHSDKTGNGKDSTRVHTTNLDAVKWIKVHAAEAGYFVTGVTNFTPRIGNVEYNESYSITLSMGETAWRVVSVDSDLVEEVYCAVVPGVHRFTLASGVYTGNCGVVIDAVANRMEILSVTASSGTSTDEAASSAATATINDIWDENELGNYIPSWHRKTLRDGDGYVVVWPTVDDGSTADPDDEVIEDDLTVTPTGVNITYVDPRLGRMFYDSENPRKKKFFAQMWECVLPGETKPKLRLNLFYPDRIEKYVAKTTTTARTTPAFEPYYDMYDVVIDEVTNEPDQVPVWPIPNPYNQIPVFHLRTDLNYGKPEHRNAFSLQDAISKIIEMQMVTINFQGYPQRYAIQEAESFGTQHVREDPLDESSAATEENDVFADNTNLINARTSFSNETGSNYEASPGGMQLFKNFKEVGAFSSADPAAFLEPWREYGKAISTTTDTPLYKFQGLGGQVPSGESLKVLEAPLNKKVRDRCRLFGATWRSVFEFALEIMGATGRVNVTWANPASTDLMEVWQLAKLKIELGIPAEVAFMDAGVPQAQAKEWAAIRANQPQPTTPPAVVGQ